MFTLAETSIGDVPLLIVEGELDHSGAPALQDAIASLLAGGNSRVLVDLGSCTYIDSGGLGVMMSISNQLKDRGWLGVVGASTHIMRLLDIVGLSTRRGFALFDDETQIQEAVSGRPVREAA